MITTRKRLRPRYIGLGLRGLGRIGLAGCEPEDCGAASSVSEQWACVQRNEAKQDPITGRYCTPTSTGWIDTGHGSVYEDNPGVYVPTGYTPYDGGSSQYSAPPPASTYYNPSLSFVTSRGSGLGQVLQAGDTWTISIRNARPNSQVSVYGGKDGNNALNSMGTTDGGGNWSLSGTISTDQVGSWSEQWRVGGEIIGSFAFRVAAASVLPQTPMPPVLGDPTPGPQTDDSNGGILGGFNLAVIPWWGWLAGGAGAIFLFGGGRGR